MDSFDGIDKLLQDTIGDAVEKELNKGKNDMADMFIFARLLDSLDQLGRKVCEKDPMSQEVLDLTHEFLEKTEALIVSWRIISKMDD